MPRPLPKERAPTGWKSVCPFCPYDAGECDGNPNSHNLRKHIRNKHKEQVLTYIDGKGFKMVPVTPLITIKHNAATGKYGQGFCFKCCSHIYCGMPTAATKLSVIGSHTCAVKQVREYKAKPKGDGPVAPRPKRTMTDCESVEALFEKYKVDTCLNEDGEFDLEKTMRYIKAKQDEQTFIQQLRRNKKYAPVILPMIQKAHKEHEEMYEDWDSSQEDPDDPDSKKPLFDENVVLWQLMPAILSAETKETHKDKIIAGLRIEKDQMEDQVEQCKIAQERMKWEYEERLERLCEDYNEVRAECEKLRAANKKGDSDNVIAHV